MANTSILKAFERMWLHTTNALDTKVPVSRTINGKQLNQNLILNYQDVGADSSGTASTSVSNHNISNSAHADIRSDITGLNNRLNTLANSDDETLDQMKEIVDYAKNNKGLIDGITTSKINVSDIADNLTTNVATKVLSAKQGTVLKTAVDLKVSKSGDTMTGDLTAPKFIGALQGNADTATALATSHTIRTNLASTSTASFDGTADIAPGVTGILPLTNGGTGGNMARTANAIIRFSSNSEKFSSTATANGAFYATSTNGTPQFGTLPIAQGGTGATTAASVLTNLGITSTAAELNKLDGVTTTTTELNYVSGVTSNIQTQLNKKADDYSIELYNGTSGNPKPIKFASFNYSTCSSENGIAAKISMVSGHGNGSSYAFMQDAIIRVAFDGTVSVDNFKYYGADTGTYDSTTRQYGDIFWVVDTTNKIVDFYCLMGQYARVNSTPWKRLTYSTGGTVTQHTTAVVYSSGTKTWANNSDIALKKNVLPRIALLEDNVELANSEIEQLFQRVINIEEKAVSVLSGTTEPTSSQGNDGDIYLVTG